MKRPTAVVGAGVVGLAVARALALRGQDVVVLESADRIGTGVTSRSSEVIHAGLYYPPGSLKGRTCVRGRELLYAYAAERGVPHRQTGKLIVATDPSQVDALSALRDNARRSGAGELLWLTPEAVRDREPQVRCVAGLWSERSGIVDSHALCEALATDLQDAGGAVVLRTHARRVDPVAGILRVHTDDHVLACDQVVLANGLDGRRLAATCLPVPPAPTKLAKGSYMALSGCPAPFRHLVYPLPEAGGLGIHATVDLAGRVRFGPDVEWVDGEDYTPSADVDRFEAAVRRYWPDLPDGCLSPAYAGIRPKLVGPGEPAADFRILGPAEHGTPGLTALLGIESPGLTAALALAELVAARTPRS